MILIPAKKDGKYGYVNREASWIVEPRFDLAFPFFDGLALIAIRKKNLLGKVAHRYGYIDDTGEMVIKPRFKEAFSFSEGLATIINPGPGRDRWG